MASLKQRATAYVDRARARSRLLDHAVLTQQHYGKVQAGQAAGAVTYFAFLSFFPILALAFFVVGYVARVYPAAQDNLVRALQTALPGLVGTGAGQLSLDDIQGAAGTVGLLGLAGVLYSGLGWLSGMRQALTGVFRETPSEQPNFVIGKARDLMTLAVIGLTLVVSVAVAGLVTGFSQEFLDLLHLSRGLTPVLALLGVVVGVAADMLLFFVLFRLLARPRLPSRSLWAGAALGAVGAELLKFASSFLIGATKDQSAFRAFGVALILLVWINYFSRVVMYAAAWAYTAPLPAAVRPSSDPASPAAVPAPLPAVAFTSAAAASELGPATWFGAGAAAMLGLMAILRGRGSRKSR